MDLQSETMITESIRGLYPDHQILAEEKASQESDSAYKWIIDPLDGTTNYAHGYRFFCVSIAVEHQHDVIFGVVYDPVTKELFKGIRGGGAFLNGRPIRSSVESQLSESLICTGFSYDREGVLVNLFHFNNLILEARAVRRDGSAALDLCYVACGRYDGFWEISLNPWDVAAGKLIVEEAGGRISSFSGNPCTVYDAEILATNGRIHEQMMTLLTRGPSSNVPRK